MTRTWLLALCVVSVACFAPRPNLPSTVVSRRAPVSAPVTMGTAKNGIFTPLVKLTKWAVGEDRFLSFRARVIGEHTKVIQAFVDTADTPFGCIALEKLFDIADVDGSGTIDRAELELALKKLGFTHLTESQIDTIMKKADGDDNCVIDYDEFVDNAPKALKVNLVKLAKNNGADLGFLS
jgi:hypothetical protein